MVRWLSSAIHPHWVAIIYGTLDIAVLYPTASRPDLRGLAMLLAGLLVPSQVCMIAIWSSLTTIPASIRAVRAVLWLFGLYFCLLGMVFINPGDSGVEFPLILALGMFGLFAGTVWASIVLRRHGWRLVKSPDELRDDSSALVHPLQFHLADLLGWITMVCVFLALGVATIPKFWTDHALYSYGPSQEAALMGSLCGCFFLSVGAGFFATGIFWLALGIADFGPASRQAMRDPRTGLVAWCLLICTCAAVFGAGTAGAAIMVLVLVAVVVIAAPLGANAMILRGLGFRLARIPRPTMK